MVKKMAFLGGTFDPPHYGHIWLARKALQELPVQTVRVIPNGVPPHRPQPRAPWVARVVMCELALQNVADVVVGRDEPPGSNVHWTLRTLQRLRRRHGRAPLLIIGADSFAQFHRWRCWQRILSLTNVVVAARHGAVRPRSMVRMRCRVVTRSQQLIGNCGRVFFWRSGAPAVSSTNIRQRLKKRQSVTHLLPLSVLTEIQQQELYAG